MAKNKHVLVRSKLSNPEQNKGTTVEQDKSDPIQENVNINMAPNMVDQGIQNNETSTSSEPPPPPSPALAPGAEPALAPGVVPTLAPGVAPALQPAPQPTSTEPALQPAPQPTQVEPALAPGIVPTLAPGVAPALAPGVVPTLAPGVAPTTTQDLSKVDPKSTKVTDTSAPSASDFEKTLSKLKADGTKAEKDLINNLENYMAKMKPGIPVEVEKGAQNQHQLWKTISGLAENAPLEEFRKLWSILLTYFHEYRDGVFHQRYAFRFAEYWRHGEPDLNAFQRIVNVIQLTADPAERKQGLRQVSLERSLAEGFSEEARQRIISFYN